MTAVAKTIIVSVIWLISLSLHAETTLKRTQEFNSGELRVPLIELFTSEGCSSCPKADAWLSDLSENPRLWQRFVPVAFHVDYWNKLGWEDRFSSSRFSRRQRTYKAQGNINSVYTPGFVVAGAEWRGWFSKQPLPDPDTSIVGNLKLEIENGTRFVASYERLDKSRTPLQLTIALLGMDLETEVKHGENSGRRLHHDFVVLDVTEEVSKAARWSGSLPKRPKQARLAIAAWVSELKSLTPLQAVGGYLHP